MLKRSLPSLALLLSACSPAPDGPESTGATVRNPDVGERAFVRCRACHSLRAGEDHKVGPNLHGFMTRPAGTAEGYQYSPELIDAGLVWDETLLSAWITDPAFVVSGTTMVYANDLQGDEIVALVDYLKSQTEVSPSNEPD